MDFETQYRAIASRDVRFDGQFYTAVSSTGIYCRPSCPARTPKAANVRFFVTSAAAHQAGYRACKRCLPEAVPGTPAWNLGNDVASRAMRLIADGAVERDGVPGLAAKLGYSSRHLGRVLTEQLGAGPLALSRALRAQTARNLLTATSMPLSDVAFAAGFSSIRTFNETMAEVFDLTPSAIRSRYKTAGLSSAGEVRLTLPYRKPFDAPGIFAFLAARAVDGVEIASESSYARTVSLPSGPAEFEVSYDRGRMSLVARLQHMNDLSALHARVRRLFDLDADPVAVDAALTADARFAARVHAIPGIRLPGAIDGSEIVIRALFGQQITVVQARRLLSELTAELGEPVESQFGLTKLFPAAAAIAERPELFRGPVARQNTIRTVAYALADKSLDVGFGSDLTELERSMTAFKGVGPWTAGYVAMRVLGSPDILLDTDVALKAGARRLGIHGSLRGELAHLSPWRSYASLHLWRAAAPALANPTIPEPS